ARAGAGNGRTRLKRLTAEALVRTGSLFAGLCQDPYLTADVRQLLGYLYLPVLRIGLLEGRFWTDPGHPARRLLGLLAELGEFWIGSDAQDRVVYPQLHASVGALCQDYMDDSTVLLPILHDLEAFAERMGQRARMTLAR